MKYEEFHIPDKVFWGFEGNNNRTSEMIEFYKTKSPETYGKYLVTYGNYLVDLEHVTNSFLGLSYIDDYVDYSANKPFGRSILKFRIIDKHKFMLAKIMFPDLNFSLDLNKVQLLD